MISTNKGHGGDENVIATMWFGWQFMYNLLTIYVPFVYNLCMIYVLYNLIITPVK